MDNSGVEGRKTQQREKWSYNNRANKKYKPTIQERVIINANEMDGGRR